MAIRVSVHLVLETSTDHEMNKCRLEVFSSHSQCLGLRQVASSVVQFTVRE